MTTIRIKAVHFTNKSTSVNTPYWVVAGTQYFDVSVDSDILEHVTDETIAEVAKEHLLALNIPNERFDFSSFELIRRPIGEFSSQTFEAEFIKRNTKQHNKHLFNVPWFG